MIHKVNTEPSGIRETGTQEHHKTGKIEINIIKRKGQKKRVSRKLGHLLFRIKDKVHSVFSL